MAEWSDSFAGSASASVVTAMSASTAARVGWAASAPSGAAPKSAAVKRMRPAAVEVVEVEKSVNMVIDREEPEVCFDFAGVYDSDGNLNVEASKERWGGTR